MENLVSISLVITYILFGITLVISLLMPLLFTIKNFDFKKAKGGIIKIGILLVILIFAFVVSSGEIGPIHEQFGINSFQSKLIGGGIITTYLLVICAFIAAIYSEIANKLR
ncbi:MAG: hypothetical protein PHT69_09060 [Bacteroidales bacterium]|nr:hypothetical protein [Bacteroidales bacterium]